MSYHAAKSMESQAITKLRLSEEFLRLTEIAHREEMTYLGLFRELRSQGNSVIALLFALPFILPIPVPGLSVLFGLVIAFIGVRIAFAKKPWLPKKWGKKIIPQSVLIKMLAAGVRLMTPLERFIKPRGRFFSTHRWTKSATGLAIALCGGFLALPLPPGTNFPPATAIILLSIGNLEEDGVLLSLGYFVVLINIGLFILLPILGFEQIKNFLPS